MTRPVLKQEYVQMQRTLYHRFFKALTITLTASPVIEFGSSFFAEDFTVFFTVLILASTMWLFLKRISKFQKYQELAITIFLFILEAAFIIIFYKFNNNITFGNSSNAFYFGVLGAHFEAAMTNRIPDFKYRTAFRLSVNFLRFLTVPMIDKGELPVHFVCSALLIYLDYEREQFDQKLFGSYFYSKEQLSKFKDLLVNDIPESVVVLSQESLKCLFANNSFLKLIPENSVEKIGLSLNQFCLYEEISHGKNPKKNLVMILQDWISQEKTHRKQERTSCNLSFKTLSSGEKIFEAKIIPLIWDEKNAIGLVLHDITQQNAIIQLKINANNQKDRMLATISHELRTPLNGILGMIQIIQQKIQDKDVLQYLNICNSSGQLLLGLVNSILDLNLIRASKFQLYPEKINLVEFLQDILKLFEYQCKLKSLNLKLKVSSFAPKFLVTDKNRLSQILINLIGNALKFTSKGEIVVSAQPYREASEYLEICVQDTGIGIKEEDKGKLFQIFGKLENEKEATAVNNQGVGLGLTISNNLAELLCENTALQGIKLESKYHEGSRFSFLVRSNLNEKNLNTSFGNISSAILDEGELGNLPETRFYKLPSLKNPHIQQKRRPVIPSPTMRSSLSQNRAHNFVLIVDDNPLNLAVAELFVLKQQYQVKTALHGKAALDLMLNNNFKTEPIKLVLMDLQMPLMDGYETTKTLKDLVKEQRIPDVPIVALTANDSIDERKICSQVGMCDYLTKPIKETELIRILNQLVKK